MTILSRLLSDLVILDVSGRLCFDERSLGELSKKFVNQGYRFIGINLENISHMDASGLGQLLLVRKLVLDKCGEVWLIRPSDRVSKLLTITKLISVFQIARDENEILEQISDYLSIPA